LQPKDKILELEKAVPPTRFVHAFSRSRILSLGCKIRVIS
jgi:hypothetical protein